MRKILYSLSKKFMYSNIPDAGCELDKRTIGNPRA